MSSQDTTSSKHLGLFAEAKTAEERSNLILNNLKAGNYVYVYEPTQTIPRRLDFTPDSKIEIGAPLTKPKEVKAPTVKQPERPGVFVRFINKISRGTLFKDRMDQYNRDQKAYEDAQEKYTSDLKTFDEKKKAHDLAARQLQGASKLRNIKLEAAKRDEMKKSTEMTVDQLSGKETEQVDTKRKAQPSMANTLDASKK